jgi:hypothetical protein
MNQAQAALAGLAGDPGIAKIEDLMADSNRCPQDITFGRPSNLNRSEIGLNPNGCAKSDTLTPVPQVR